VPQEGESMKVGDLVKFAAHSVSDKYIGLITEVGVWTGNCDVKVLWARESQAVTQKSVYLEVINESR
jgi:hypothetical protein